MDFGKLKIMIHKKIAINTLNKNPKGYIEILPDGFSTANKYPVIYWLHGLGERADGSIAALDKVYNITISQWLKSNNINFIVLVPQDSGGYWNGTNGIQQFVEWAEVQYGAVMDVNQWHLSGLSAGGYGIRDFIKGNSEVYKKFSTFTPMSTNFDTAVPYVQRILDNNQKVWFHHGTADGVANAITAVINFHKALYKIDPSRSMLTAYENMGHTSWEEVYDSTGRIKKQRIGLINGVQYHNWLPTDPDWYTWLTANGKKPVQPPVTEVFLDKIKVENGVASSVGTDGKMYSWLVGHD